MPGICVFVDGAPHDQPERAARDRATRDELEDRGFRVIVIRWAEPIAAQLAELIDIFGSPSVVTETVLNRAEGQGRP